MEAPKQDFRVLKVHTRFKPEGKTVAQVPELVLKGDWLKELGFQCGELVKICTAGPILQIIRMVNSKEVEKWNQLQK